MSNNKKQLNSFINKWTSFLEAYDFEYEDLLHFRSDCIDLEFETKKALEFLDKHQVSTFNHDSMFFILNDVYSMETLSSLLLFSIHSKLDWKSENEHYDLYFSNFWFILILERMRHLINVQVEKQIVNKIVLRFINETCVIDRVNGFIEYTIEIEDEKITTRYDGKKLINQFVKDMSQNYFFKIRTYNTEKVHLRPKDLFKYRFEITYENKDVMNITGYLDYYDLPLDYRLFVYHLDQLFNLRPNLKMFDPSYYFRLRKRENENMYCRVVFEDSDKAYTYLSNDITIMQGDRVIVPAGLENIPTEVEVVSIFYQTEDKINPEYKPIKEIINKV